MYNGSPQLQEQPESVFVNWLSDGGTDEFHGSARMATRGSDQGVQRHAHRRKALARIIEPCTIKVFQCAYPAPLSPLRAVEQRAERRQPRMILPRDMYVARHARGHRI